MTRRRKDQGGARFLGEVASPATPCMCILCAMYLHAARLLVHCRHAAAQVALLLIDEVHLLNENRGAALEAGVVSRIKMISRLPTVQGVRMRAALSVLHMLLRPKASTG